ncbi:MAG: membrane protein insertase YidC [Rickettsiales bacterium]
MHHPHLPDEKELRNQMLAVGLAIIVLFFWQFLSKPLVPPTTPQEQKKESLAPVTANAPMEREDAKSESPRVTINSNELAGTIALKGARFDDLLLKKYRETVEKDSKNVTLLSPGTTEQAYFAQFGWLGKGTTLPDAETIWEADHDTLTPGQPVTLTWTNEEGVTFEQVIALDKDFLFTVTQRVKNTSGSELSLSPYGLINRAFNDTSRHFAILHEGPLGVDEGALSEIKYSDLKKDKTIVEDKAESWLGITDKYWLAAIVPPQGGKFKATYSYYQSGGHDRYQVDFLSPANSIAAGKEAEDTLHFFAGAKEVMVLDRYAKDYNIPLFDRAVDFGRLYFLTKPMFYALNYFFHLLGNFGLAILLLTICVKALMFPLANKAYHGMSQMKLLMPKMEELKKKYQDDPLKLNQEMMGLYKKEKINPASGCLPLLLQIPVFFALYKVLFVTIEMRHAPFFGWIHDLSAGDPTNVFTLFGLIHWTPPSFLHLGAWPLIMGITMVLQYRLNPKPTDPVQAKMMAWLPYIFTFMLASFPAGLVIYWAWNNTLSILQQTFITRSYNKKQAKKKAA